MRVRPSGSRFLVFLAAVLGLLSICAVAWALTSPRTTVTSPADGAVVRSSDLVIQGTATHEVGISHVRLVVKDVDDSSYWNGSSWQQKFVMVDVPVDSSGATRAGWAYVVPAKVLNPGNYRARAFSVSVERNGDSHGGDISDFYYEGPISVETTTSAPTTSVPATSPPTTPPTTAPPTTAIETAVPPTTGYTGQPTLGVVTAGNDWTVPPCARRAQNSGIYWTDLNAKARSSRLAGDVHGVNSSSYTTPRYAPIFQSAWSVLNPSEGTYNFSTLDAQVNALQNESAGVGYVLWIATHNIPEWVNRKAGTDFADARNLWNQREANGDYTFNEIFRPFADAVTARYGSDPRLVAIEMRTPFDAAHGEWALGGAERQDGPAEPWVIDWHRVWYEQMVANGGDPSKLIMMAAQPTLGADAALADGFGLGMGQRDGFPGPTQVWQGGYGLQVEDGQLRVDEAHPNFTQSGTTYSENTEYLFHDSSWGDPVNAYGTFRRALTWNLLIGRNWISYPNSSWADGNQWPLNGLSGELREEYIQHRQMIRWSEYQLGKTVETTDEAFVLLGQRTHEGSNWNGAGSVTVDNIGRWLEQRDIPGGRTVPVLPRQNLHRFYDWNIDENADYSARRTDLAGGNRNVYFDVDERVTDATAKVEIKVSYIDSTRTSFNLEYHDGSSVVSTPTHATQNLGGRQTVTFNLPRLSGANRVDGMDIKLVITGSADVTLDMVRIVKPDC